MQRNTAVAAFALGAASTLASIGLYVGGEQRRAGETFAIGLVDLLIALSLFAGAKRRASELLAEVTERR